MSASARQQKHEEERPCWPAFHFHSVLLIFVYLWPISTFCVADMDMLWPIWFVADIVVSRRFLSVSCFCGSDGHFEYVLQIT